MICGCGQRISNIPAVHRSFGWLTSLGPESPQLVRFYSRDKYFLRLNLNAAHSFCQRCHQHGILASSFFFDRETVGRNSSQKLFSTIARDLASIEDRFAEHLSMAVERDPSLATAGVSRQFDGLILGPSDFLAGYGLIVIVIDALDEGYNHNNDLLVILAKYIYIFFRVIFALC
jgi:hypothetical protein